MQRAFTTQMSSSRVALLGVVLLASLMMVTRGAQAITYAIDAPPYDVGTFIPGSDVIAFNAFTAVPGASTIETISVLWADDALPQTVTLALFDDPDDDAIFTDAVLLRAIDVPFDGIGTGTFQDYSIPPTAVSGVFGAAAYIEDGLGTIFPVLFEASPEREGGFALRSEFPDLTVAVRSALPFNDVAIRATSATANAVAEPGSMALLALALAAVLLCNIRRIKATAEAVRLASIPSLEEHTRGA
jgi:hypothetical protein